MFLLRKRRVWFAFFCGDVVCNDDPRYFAVETLSSSIFCRNVFSAEGLCLFVI